jgi:outer membrane putative beta-barrel porin/alpha-amylase
MLAVAEARADSCPKPSEEIVTDRPHVTNSSIVVPVGSLQNENGINLSERDGGQTLDGTNSRWRLGVAPCFEVFIDLPTYFANAKAPGVSGFSDVGPALKWSSPGKDRSLGDRGCVHSNGNHRNSWSRCAALSSVSVVMGIARWLGFSGMFTEFFRPANITTKRITEATFVIEKKLTEKFSLFTEYVGDYPEGNIPSQLINSGGLYHLTPNQQLDFHFALGLNRNSPTYIVGIGYSFRVDGLFRQ